MVRVSDLTEAENEYLVSRHPEYRRTPGRDKEAFREECAKHIIEGRGLPVDDEYKLDLFNTKVRNWFLNNAPVKKARLPVKVNTDFDPERVFGMLKQADIRKGLEESRPANVADDAPHVVVWNAKRKEMWNELTAEDKAAYERLATLWSEEGPDDDLKPEMAERRAVSWMKAVTLLFWQQCRMPIFIYGCFEDTKAQLQGATFDTSLLFEDTKEGKGKPTFRQSKEWATDFRRYFYEYFTTYIRPDLASPEAMEYLRTTSKKVVEPFDFDSTDDGWPLLPSGTEMSHTRRQEVLRLWFKELYSLACGREVLAVPWSSIVKKPNQFFPPGAMPTGFHIDDPSHICWKDLIDFFAHVQMIQHPPADAPADLPPRFEFSHFETGPETARSYPEAINSGEVEEWQPRHAKKKVRPPTFDAPPGATDGEGDDEDDTVSAAAPRRAPARGRFNPGPKFYKDVKHIQRENARAKARREKEKAKAAKAKAKAKAKRRKGKSKASGSTDEELWATDDEDSPEEEELDFEELDINIPDDENDTPQEETDFSDTDARARPRVPAADDHLDDSGEEVEEELERYADVLSSSAAVRNAASSSGPSRLDAESVSVARAVPSLTTAASTIMRSAPAAADPVPVSDRAIGAPPSSPTRNVQEEHSKPPSAGRADETPADLADHPWAVPVGADLAPADVPADGPSRVVYLRSLDNDRAYSEMLDRAHPLLVEKVAIRVQPPLFWASWGYKFPFLPREAHVGDKAPKTLQGIINFLKKGLPKAHGPVEAQRFCLVMGLTLRNIMALQFVEPGEDWPERLPQYMEGSSLSFKVLSSLQEVCRSAFRCSDAAAAADADHQTPPEPVASASSTAARSGNLRKGKGRADVASSQATAAAERPARRGRGAAAQRAAANEAATEATDATAKKATRRSTRLRS